MIKSLSRSTGLLLLNMICLAAFAQKDIYEIRMYLLKSENQVRATDQFLKNAYLPALHRLGFQHVGVFKPIANDTATLKKIYVLVTYPSLDSWQNLKTSLQKDRQYTEAAKSFAEADTGKLPFVRMESSLLEAFPHHTRLTVPEIQVNSGSLYELRSYESPTDGLHNKKVRMFNEGGETGLFKRLNFNPVFYGEVLSGSHLPNLMYLVVFENDKAREDHWKAFGNDPEWKKISSDPQYENPVSVSHIDSILMRRTDYSDL